MSEVGNLSKGKILTAEKVKRAFHITERIAAVVGGIAVVCALYFQIEELREGRKVQEALLVSLSWQALERGRQSGWVEKGQSAAFRDLASLGQLQSAKLDRMSLKPVSLVPGSDLSSIQANSLTASQLDASNLKMRNASFAGPDFYDVSFEGSDLAGTDFLLGNLYHTKATRADFGGAWLVESRLEEMQAGISRWRGSRWLGVDVDRGALEGADFTSSILVGVTFFETNLDKANFHGAVLKSVEYVSAKPVSPHIFDGACILKSDLVIAAVAPELPIVGDRKSISAAIVAKVDGGVLINGTPAMLPACDLDYLQQVSDKENPVWHFMEPAERGVRSDIWAGRGDKEEVLLLRLRADSYKALSEREKDNHGPPNLPKQNLVNRIWWDSLSTPKVIDFRTSQ